jgi:outer membrane phospholipase A
MNHMPALAPLAACSMLICGCAVAPPPKAAPTTAPSSTSLSSTAPAHSQPSTEASTQPSTEPSAQMPPNVDLHPRDHHVFPSIMAYKPIYILVGPEDDNVKFQFSTKIPLLFPGGPDQPDPVLSNLYFGYTQMSLWDIEQLGKATIDTTFQPEVFFATQTPPPPFEIQGFRASGVSLQFGGQHESNGRSGEESRNINYLYFQPTIFFGDRKKLHGEAAMRGRVFVASLDDNPDIEDYIGHFELSGAVRFGDALHVTLMGRFGDDPGRGAFQLDATYPLQKLRLDAYLHLQYFNGYGESLLDYREHSNAVRLGVSFVR